MKAKNKSAARTESVPHVRKCFLWKIPAFGRRAAESRPDVPRGGQIRGVSFLLPQIIMGGVEKVLVEILAELKKTETWDLRVYSISPVKDQYFIDFFKDSGITLKSGWRLEKPKRLLPKIGYKIVGPFYKIIGKMLLAQRLRGAEFLIDFQLFSFARIIRKCRAPKIVWAHGSINHFNNKCGWLVRYLNRYDRFVVLSDSFMEDFKEQYPEYAGKAVRIYNSIDAEKVRAKAKADKSRGKYFVVVSRMDSEKDNETVIGAFKMFAETTPDAKLYMVGEGPLKHKMERMAAGCPQIEFLGKIDEPYTIIKNSIGHILSSYSEGLPMVLLENAALGALSIASACKSGVPEILMDGRAGILFTPGDKRQLARIMNKVWNGKIDSEKLIKTASDNIGRFSAKQNVKQIADLIREDCYEKINKKDA
jgi:glycosyltransferase involved in cell wall biosynthesis